MKISQTCKLIKKFVSGILVSLTIVTYSAAAPVSAQAANTTGTAITQSNASSIVVKVNDKVIALDDSKPYIDSNSKVMIPLVPVLKQIKSDTSVQVKGRSVIVKDSNISVRFNSGDEKVTANGKLVTLSTKPLVSGEKVFVPLEFFSEVLNELVDWDSTTQIVKISNTEKNTEDSLNKPLFYTKDKIIATKLDDYLNALQKSDNFHGSVLVAKDGNILLNKGYGMANFEQNIKNKSQTRFLIGSMTKQFTAMAIMQLEEKGLLSEQDKLSKYVPDFPHGDEITIYNLLTHTSGIKSLDRIPGFFNMKPEDLQNINAAINFFKNQPLDFKPGTEFEYSNSGYILLGYIVEKVSGMNYENYLNENIFKPLNMNNTGIGYIGKEKMYNSSGYQGYLDVVPISDELVIDGVHGAGNLYSTTEDLYRWNMALDTEKLVSKKTMDKMFSKYVEMYKGSDIYYGYGWMIADTKNGHEVFHGGNMLGFTSNIARYTDKGLSIIILTNAGYYNINPLTYTLSNIALGDNYSMPKARNIIKLDNTSLNKYVGKYEIEGIGNVFIKNEDGHLYFCQDGVEQKYELFPESQYKFFLRTLDGDITFDTNSNGQVTGIDITNFIGKYHGDRTN